MQDEVYPFHAFETAWNAATNYLQGMFDIEVLHLDWAARVLVKQEMRRSGDQADIDISPPPEWPPLAAFFVSLMTQPIQRKLSKSAGRVNGQPPPDYIFEIARALARMLAREDHKHENTSGKVRPQ
jgi:hypothetical protein